MIHIEEVKPQDHFKGFIFFNVNPSSLGEVFFLNRSMLVFVPWKTKGRTSALTLGPRQLEEVGTQWKVLLQNLWVDFLDV